MRIEIWSDIICPWCGLGSHQLDRAIKRFGHDGEVEVVRRSFILDESLPIGVTWPVMDVLRSRKGLTEGQAREVTGQLERLAVSEGLTPYRVLDNQVGSSALAHELAAWATDIGRGGEVWRALYKAYYAEARPIFNVESLVALATECRLSEVEARTALTSRRYQSRIRDDIRDARALGATGVPFTVIDRRLVVKSARSVDALVQAMEHAWRDRQPMPQPATNDGAMCGPEGCPVPHGT